MMQILSAPQKSDLAVLVGTIGLLIVGMWFPTTVLILLGLAGASLAAAKSRQRFIVANVEKTCLYWPMVIVPTATGLVYQSRVLSVLLLIAAAIWAVGPGLRVVVIASVWPLGVLTTVAATIWLRDPSRLTLITAVCVMAILLGARTASLRGAGLIESAVQALAVYLLVSVVMHLLGFSSIATSVRLGGLDNSAGGDFTQRIAFPLAASFTTTPLMAAAFLAGLPAFKHMPVNRLSRYARTAAVPCSVYVLIAANYRAALGAAVILCIAGFVSPRLLAKLAPTLAVGSLTLAVWYSYLSGTVQAGLRIAATVAPSLTREADGGLLNNRDLIWSSAHRVFENESWLHKLFGYGGNGQIKSGASAEYAPLFKGFIRGDVTLLISPHSGALQLLFDGGILGLLAFGVALAVLLSRAARTVLAGDFRGVALTGALVALAVGGATEVGLTPTKGPLEPFWMLLLFATAGMMSTPQRVEAGQAPSAKVQSQFHE